ncbi:IS1096 element passenger TnpR family protein [Agromyces laixinhei]|uniref:IS1096 element passenger TnpR family protein n=1 Tax=Agromyces laixinhei TaxID=2585717 RepID=UPI0012EE3FDD|nr:hypothetical protein [Agromyces laixinhei]
MRRRSDPQQQLILRIDLERAEHETWREIAIDGTARLDQLADAIVIAFGWTGTGTHAFGSTWPGWCMTEYGSYEHDLPGAANRVGAPERIRPLGRRDRRPDAWREYSYYPDADEFACEHAWTVAEAVEQLGDDFVFEYRRHEPDYDRDPPPGWRHRIRAIESSKRPLGATTATVVAGAGLIPRDIAESAYGELADPAQLHLLEHEFEVRFGAGTAGRLGFAKHGLSLDDAVAGASVAARRALRMDLVDAGILLAHEIEREVAERVTTPIRDILRLAAAPDGVEPSSLGELGDDLHALRLLRRSKGRLHTLAEVRDRVMERPLELWRVLAARLMNAGAPRYSPSTSSKIAEFAVELARAEREVRTFAFDEAHRDAGGAGSRVLDFNRVLRVLVAMGLVDEDGAPSDPAARPFAMTMLKS